MNRLLEKTLDGSQTIYVPELDEHYHSTNGAIQEAVHIYINKAYLFSQVESPIVFEVGFGTGLNALLTALEAEKHKRKTLYISIEKYPLEKYCYSELNYPDILGESANELYRKIYSCEWNKISQISDYFSLQKIQGDFTTLPEIPLSDVVYYDAFAPNKQSSMWTSDIFRHLFLHINKDGILTTYCAKGEVRRTMQAVGFVVERTDGPVGKREILRAVKP